ncbi:hypothetical protein NL453_28335, partial [Klebsiella pneumoniae]|nr:hypothetical protein [Klebsiella pneumoniae]
TRTVLLAAAGLSLSFAAAGAHAQTKTYKGAPEFEFGALKIKPRGRIFLDQVWQEVERKAGADEDLEGGRVRMARIGVQGSVGDV